MDDQLLDEVWNAAIDQALKALDAARTGDDAEVLDGVREQVVLLRKGGWSGTQDSAIMACQHLGRVM